MPLSLATLGAILLGIFLGAKAATAVATTTMAASETVMLKYSRDDEDEADHLGLKYMDKSGYDRKAMVFHVQENPQGLRPLLQRSARLSHDPSRGGRARR